MGIFDRSRRKHQKKERVGNALPFPINRKSRVDNIYSNCPRKEE